MNDKKYKTLIALMSALLVISVALFALQNFAFTGKTGPVDATIENTTTEETITIYRAIEDIPAYSIVSPTMFERVTIPKIDDVGFVTDIHSVTNTYARGNIFRGSFATNELFSSEDFESGLGYSIEIRPDLTGNIQYGDIVDVYSVTGNTVTQILSSKKLYQPMGQSGNALGKIYIKVNRSELITYYSMLNSHKFILTPVDSSQLEPLPSSIVGNPVYPSPEDGITEEFPDDSMEDTADNTADLGGN